MAALPMRETMRTVASLVNCILIVCWGVKLKGFEMESCSEELGWMVEILCC